MTYEENVEKLSKALIRAGRTENTTEHIHKKVKALMDAGEATTKPGALTVFKSDKAIKRALAAGSLEEVSFDVLAVVNGNMTKDEVTTPFQEVSIAINRNGKPEMRRTLLYDRTVALESNTAYKGKFNIGDEGRIDFPDGFAPTKLEKPMFSNEVLYKHSDPVEDAKTGQAGVWNGTVGSITVKPGSARLEVYSEASLLPTVVWTNDTEQAKVILKGDDVIFGGYNRGAKGINASFIRAVKAKPREQEVIV